MLVFLIQNLGKTTFALSLPGIYNYYKAGWSLDDWKNYADYVVIDDVPWDQFENRHFPSKKALLTCDEPAYVSVFLLYKNSERFSYLYFLVYIRLTINVKKQENSILICPPSFYLILKMLEVYLTHQTTKKKQTAIIGKKMLLFMLWVRIRKLDKHDYVLLKLKK